MKRVCLFIAAGTLSLGAAFIVAFAAAALVHWTVHPFEEIRQSLLVPAVGAMAAFSGVRYFGIGLFKAMHLLVPNTSDSPQSSHVRCLCITNVGAATFCLIVLILLDSRGTALTKCLACSICITWAWFFARDFANKASSLAWASAAGRLPKF
jgi:hypothetical protein